MIEVSRRRFFGFLAAPAIVHAANLMPVKALARSGGYIMPPDWMPLINPGLMERELGSGYLLNRVNERFYPKIFNSDLEASFRKTKEYLLASALDPEGFPIDTDVLTLS